MTTLIVGSDTQLGMSLVRHLTAVGVPHEQLKLVTMVESSKGFTHCVDSKLSTAGVDCVLNCLVDEVENNYLSEHTSLIAAASQYLVQSVRHLGKTLIQLSSSSVFARTYQSVDENGDLSAFSTYTPPCVGCQSIQANLCHMMEYSLFQQTSLVNMEALANTHPDSKMFLIRLGRVVYPKRVADRFVQFGLSNYLASIGTMKNLRVGSDTDKFNLLYIDDVLEELRYLMDNYQKITAGTYHWGSPNVTTFKTLNHYATQRFGEQQDYRTSDSVIGGVVYLDAGVTDNVPLDTSRWHEVTGRKFCLWQSVVDHCRGGRTSLHPVVM